MLKALINTADGKFEERHGESIADFKQETGDRVWIEAYKPDIDEMNMLKDKFTLHPLAVEDCFTLDGNLKLDTYDDHSFIVFSAPVAKKNKRKSASKFRARHLFIFFSRDFVITVHHKSVPYLDTLYDKVCEHGNILEKGTDIIFHKIIDLSIDHYSDYVLSLERRMERLEDALLFNPKSEYLQMIFNIKKFVNKAKQNSHYQLMVIDAIIRSGRDLSHETGLHFKDVRDHVTTITDSLERQRETLNTLLNIFMSSSSNKLSETMKILTLWTVIMMPATFIVGYYGMNVEFPEQQLGKWALLVPVGLILLVTVSLIIIFKKRKWM